ncbi:Ig-like domain-containing protein [Nocardioides sp.]|uniref:Ig-like domain-containing protein n=1 Tax=Nocardioides sp. TaxID=35761 RepID=UPI0035280A1C
MSVVSRSTRLGFPVAALLALVLTVVGLGTPASAVTLPAPSNLSPTGGTVSANPTLSWDKVDGADKYSVQVSSASDFSSLVWSVTTVNHAAVPSVALPPGPVYWRVAAKAGTTTGPWSQASLTRAALPAPTGLSPANGTVYPQPTEAATLSWASADGAKSYDVQIANDAGFTQVVRSLTTRNTSVIARNLLHTTYHWRVRAQYTNTVFSAWSSDRTFFFGLLPKAQLVAPANNSSVDDPVLTWEPVPGAAYYDLQVSTSSTFSTTLVSATRLRANSYAPPAGFAKGTYYWRVRPYDVTGTGPIWQSLDVWRFTRTFTAQAGQQLPANGSTVTEPLFFQWTPAHLADSYTLQLSTSSSFSSIYDTCTTTHTTYTPSGAGDCMPNASGTYYWRVLGSDGPSPVGGSGAQSSTGATVRSFSYRPTRPVMSSPLSGSTSVPTFRWEQVPGAAQYRVTITGLSGQGTTTATTRATSYTPRSELATGSYRWQVQTVSRGGQVGSSYSSGEQPTFAVTTQATATGSTPDPTVGAQTGPRFPTLTWTPVVDATSYRVAVRPTGGSSWSVLPDTFTYPAGEDDSSTWSPGSYQWRVTAYDVDSNSLGTSSSYGSFSITSLSQPTGQRVAMTGEAAGSSSTSCGKSLPQDCPDLRQTPVLNWRPDADAVYYQVYLAKDAALSNLMSGYPKLVDGTLDAPTLALADTTGSGSYYWAVRACRASNDCTSLSGATQAFTKTSKPVEPLTPADGDTVTDNTVTLTWRDYADTSQDPTAFPIVESTGVQSVPPGVEARQYRVQVATDSSFTSTSRLSDDTVSQTQFTSPTELYAPGTYYWRVRAIDTAGNSLPWSATQSFTKQMPRVSLLSPVDGASVPGTAPLVWAAQPAVVSYDVELYKNADSPVRISKLRSTVPTLVPSYPLEMSSKPYVWRVRPIDAAGNVGRWTLLNTGGEFTVVGDAPDLVSPADDAFLQADEAVFTWTGVAGAAKYRWDRRNANTKLVAQRAVTVATAYAPTSKLPTGSWEWRAVALDTAGKPLGYSAWRGFRTDSTGPKVSGYSPRGTVSKSASFKVTFNEQVMNVDEASFTITASGGSNPLATNVWLDSTKKVATLNPDANLVKGKKYVLRLTSDITDQYGNPMKPFSWTITAS